MNIVLFGITALILKTGNLITHNVKEPIRQLLLIKSKHHHNELNQEFVEQISFHRENHSIKSIPTTPLVITLYFFKTYYIKGYDINGIISHWSINAFNKSLHETILSYIQLHKDELYIQFLIYWKNLPFHSPIQNLENSCRL